MLDVHDEAMRNGSLKNNTKKGGNDGELSRNENVRNDNKRSRNGRAFAIVTNPVKKEYTGPRMVTIVNDRNPTTARGAYFECCGTDHYKAACPRLNQSSRQGGNRQINLWLLREVKVVETMTIMHVEEHS
ncbi:hypothetical protein Tco_1278020 [Tanacetum coccineum]